MKFQVGSVSVEMIEADDRVCAHINAGKSFEPRSLQIWADFCATRGGTVLDVGGYTGLFSIAAALHMRRVIAFEPMPRNAARFRENAKANNVQDWIQLIECAASDKCGTIEIGYSPTVKGLTSGASLLRKTGSKLTVPMVTIDLLDLHHIAAIKIDVERNEPAVLRGARQTISRCKPAILLEVLDEPCKAGVLAALPDYRIAEEIDERNWLLLPC